ncbi:MAG: hypothetical protein LBP68_00925 [Acidobacteriota bacterium]|jgi:hypothetical protein|nr:hypothetical protein [Acidobacteriota bacterium]
MYDTELDNLERMIRRLAVGYRIHLSGSRSGRPMKPPAELTSQTMQVERLIQKLSESSGIAFAQRYRLSTLVTRYYTYRDLWRRLPQQQKGVPPPNGNNLPPEPASDSQIADQIAMRVTIANPQSEEGEIRKLYDAFLRLSSGQGQQEQQERQEKTEGLDSQFPPLSWPQFLNYITGQVRRIQKDFEQSGNSEDFADAGRGAVVFTLSLSDDAVRFTAEAKEADGTKPS